MQFSVQGVSTLDRAEALARRGHDAFTKDEALPLAFEALSNRVGDLAKRLISVAPGRFDDPVWKQAARHRDFVVHLYGRLDTELLWQTVTRSFPVLKAEARREREC